jgi:hypothetical protein|tara:strand:- start:241 stop:426 length:186 start_codon:yes stop_codon:yes gene_type:complete
MLTVEVPTLKQIRKLHKDYVSSPQLYLNMEYHQWFADKLEMDEVQVLSLIKKYKHKLNSKI